MNKKYAGGCGCLILLVVGIIAAGMFSARHVFQKGKTWVVAQIEDANRRSAIESAWKPPSAQPDARWFPAVVDQWTLSISEDIATIPELQLDRAGRRGKYRGEKQDIEVTIVPASDLERDGIFSRAETAFRANNTQVTPGTSDHGSYSTWRTPCLLSIRLNGDNIRLWWVKDWLLVFRTIGPDDPTAFADRFLEAMTPRELEKR